MECLDKLLDCGLKVRPIDKHTAEFMASTHEKAQERFSRIVQKYPNAELIGMHIEFGMGFYTVRICD